MNPIETQRIWQYAKGRNKRGREERGREERSRDERSRDERDSNSSNEDERDSSNSSSSSNSSNSSSEEENDTTTKHITTTKNATTKHITTKNAATTTKHTTKHTNPTTTSFVMLFLFSCIVRTYRIEKGAFVLWDEAHFGKFATHYLKREYFFDVHPPLGKMLTAFSAWIHSVPSSFSFSSGQPYLLDVDYCGMRVFHAVFGSAVPVLGGMLMQSLQYDSITCLAVGMMLALDNAFVSVSRLVLLDVFLLFFMGVSEIFLARMVIDNRLTASWSCLFMLGLSLGFTMSVKWIGCFTVAHTGVFVIYTLVSEVRKRSFRVFSMFIRYFLMLICLPLTVYLVVFFVHLRIINRSGPGDGEMSSWFQQYLLGNELHENDEVLLYGNKITVRCGGYAVGLLHSHKDRYPNGRQQVTTYPHKDGNNHWRVLKVGSDPKDVRPREDLVLHHQATDTYLAVEDEPSFLSGNKIVVCLTQKEMGNAITSNCVFQMLPSNSKDLKPVSTYFYLWNTSFRCYLSHSGKKLPKWGHTQGEVYCTPDKSKASIWNVEMNREKESNDTQQDIPRGNSPTKTPTSRLPLMISVPGFIKSVPGLIKSVPGLIRQLYDFLKGIPDFLWRVYDFLWRVLELNMTMHVANSALVDNGEDKMGSVPIQWMFPKKWLKFNTWDGSVPRFALLGNPLTWYAASANVLFLALLGFWGYFFAPTRHTSTLRHEKHRYNTKRAGRMYIILGGWIFHYLPFFLMTRILYLHHYLCSLFFSVAALGAFLGHNRFLLILFTFCSAISFLCFSQLTYGSSTELTRLFGHNTFQWNIYASEG